MSAVVLFRGHVVGQAPVLSYSQAGTAWVRFRVATKAMVRKQDGSGYEPPKRPVFLEVRAFGEVAEQIAEKVGKGAFVEGTGVWEQNRWTDDDGGRHQRDYVVTNHVPYEWERRAGGVEPGAGGALVEDEWGYGEEPPFDDGESL